MGDSRVPAPVGGGRGSVLVVEDNPDGLDTLVRMLSAWGFETIEAADGEVGVARGLAARPVAAVVDVGLPGLSGFEVARVLRGALGPGVTLIAHSAYDCRLMAERAGFDHFLLKPCDPAELLCLLQAGGRGGRERKPALAAGRGW